MLIQEHIINNLKSILPRHKEGDNRTIASILNAWTESICLDPISGGLYVKVNRLHTILRLQTKADAQYLVESISDKKKIFIGEEVYVATSDVIYYLNERMIGADRRKKGYLTYSEKILKTIRDLPEIQLKQEEIRQLEEETIKHLKSKRIKHFKIKKDELTNEPLKKKTAEFSHIRKKSDYRIYACNIHNGLIVNQETHQVITGENIHDEDELLSLCIRLKWNTNWYETYQQIFNR